MHRLHCLLLVSCGCSCSEVGDWFDETPRTIERWVRRSNRDGIDALIDRPHRSRRSIVNGVEADRLERELRVAPAAFGYRGQRWTGDLLRQHLSRAYGLALSTRQCQRLLRSVVFAP